MKFTIALALLMLSVAAVAITVLRPGDVDRDALAQAWKDACALSRYSCEGVDLPLVGISEVVKEKGMLGLYAGGAQIWLRPGLSTKKQRVVMAHEMTHYLQVTVGKHEFPHTPALFCILETEAWAVGNAVAAQIGALSMIKAELPEGYGCSSKRIVVEIELLP
jgi:hypothetical protein